MIKGLMTPCHIPWRKRPRIDSFSARSIAFTVAADLFGTLCTGQGS